MVTLEIVFTQKYTQLNLEIAADFTSMANKMTGVITPILTPFNHDLSIATDLYINHAHWLIEQGIHYLLPFGTTGEVLSMTLTERLSAVDALIEGGIDPAQLTQKLPAQVMRQGTALLSYFPLTRFPALRLFYVSAPK